MLKFQDVNNAAYHNKQIDYYTKQVDDPNAEADPMVPRCYGKLAQQHGREGTTYSVEEWSIVALGYNPFVEDWHKHPLKANAAKLDKNLKPIPKAIKVLADHEKKKQEKKDRDSLELVLSSDKSISLWWATQDKETQDKYLAGVNKIMETKILPLLDRFAMYEKNNQKLFADGMGFVSWFNHIESRAVDPYLHVHLNIKSNVLGLDGKYHALASDALTKNVALIDAAWQMAQADLLKNEFGLQLTATATKVDDKNDYLAEDEKNVFTFEIAGVPPELCEEYSKRSREISEELKKLGLDPTSHEAVELAQVSSRSQKTNLNAIELRNGWRTELAQKWNYTAEVANQLAQTPPQEERRIPTDSELMESFERRHMDVEFSESTFKAHVFRQLMLVQPEDVIEQRAEQLFMKENLAVYGIGKDNPYEAVEACTDPLERRALQHHLSLKATYTARHFKDREDHSFEGIERRKNETSHVLNKQDVIKALEDFQAAHSTKTKFEFKAGQIEAALMATTEVGGVSSIIGMAGTGKTTVVKFIKEQYEAQGYQVYGTATAAKATGGLLREAGIKQGGNTSELLMKLKGSADKPPKLVLTNKDIVILDEAGMTSGREICAIVDYVNKAGAKLICLGDADQLQAVGASGLFRHIADKFVSVKMTEIQRQRSDWAREMVTDMAGGRSFEGITTLFENNGISISETTEERIKLICKDFVADKSDAHRKFIVTSMNADANILNAEVQRQQLALGILSTKLGVATVEDRDGFFRKFHVGERIVFDKKTKNMDPTQFNKADNAATGKVVSIEHRKNELRAITVELDNGEQITLDKNTAKNMKLGSALTTHKSQGDTVINSYIFGSNVLANLHTAYVQLSRHKESTKLYLSKDMVNTIAEEARLADPSPAQQSWANDLIAKDLASKVINEAKAKSLRENCQSFQGCREYLNTHSEAWKAKASTPRQKLMQTQTLRDFVSLFEAYGKKNPKKATLDLEVLNERHQQMNNEIRRIPAQVVQPLPEPTVDAPTPQTQKPKPKLSMSM